MNVALATVTQTIKQACACKPTVALTPGPLTACEAIPGVEKFKLDPRSALANGIDTSTFRILFEPLKGPMLYTN